VFVADDFNRKSPLAKKIPFIKGADLTIVQFILRLCLILKILPG
jgi:hypothetical protein